MKGAPIKPGTVCMIIGMPAPLDVNNGAMVTAVFKEGPHHWRVKDHSRTIFYQDGVTGEVKPSRDGDSAIRDIRLLPITDPDADVSDDEQKPARISSDRVHFDFNFTPHGK